MMGLLSKLIRLASNKVYYFSKNLIKVYFISYTLDSSSDIQAALCSVNELHISIKANSYVCHLVYYIILNSI